MVQDLVHNLCDSLVEGVAGAGKKTPPTHITYLTQWKIVGNSEVHGNEIWSCGEYNPTDGKYHILVQPQGGSIADIALDAPLRKVNDVADTIEFPSGTDGKALVTRYLGSYNIGDLDIVVRSEKKEGLYVIKVYNRKYTQNSLLLSAKYTQIASQGSINDAINALQNKKCCYFYSTSQDFNYLAPTLYVYDTDFIGATSTEIQTALQGVELIYELATPTTELVDAPQIAEADSYSMIISQGGKAVSWSDFIYTLNYLLADSQNNILVDSENYQLTVQS